VGPTAGLDIVEKRKISYPYLESNPGRPSRSQSLYRLSYPGCSLSGHLYIFKRLFWKEKKLLAKFPKRQCMDYERFLGKIEENENTYFNLSFQRGKLKNILYDNAMRCLIVTHE
jgi:hypothetical protein